MYFQMSPLSYMYFTDPTRVFESQQVACCKVDILMVRHAAFYEMEYNFWGPPENFVCWIEFDHCDR